MRYDVKCVCGDVIEAISKEEAVKKFMNRHRFPIFGTMQYWKRDDYAEEFEVNEIR